MSLAGQIVGLLLEDRIDDIMARYPDLKLNRQTLSKWVEFDPSGNKKYFAWIVKQVALKKLKLPSGGEQIRDGLMRFERLLTIPAFTEARDINRYDAKTFIAMIRKTANLQSKTEKEKQERFKNVNLVGSAGDIQVIEIKHPQELMNRAWLAYAKGNPNWKKAPISPPTPGNEDEREWDGLWCVRFPQYATSYLSEGPFYMVYKNGGPYVGIVFEKGECQTLENEGIPLRQAEEIYPAMQELLAKKAKEGVQMTGHCTVFAHMRFLNGEAEDGETVGTLDLSGTTLKSLPNSLTVRGSLNLSNTKISALPQALTVTGGMLSIVGTKITELPLDLKVDEMEWSDPLSIDEVKKLFYRVRLPAMKAYFWKNPRLYEPELDTSGNPIMVKQINPKSGKEEEVQKPKLGSDGKKIPLSDQEKEKRWIEFQPELINHFMNKPEMQQSALGIFHYVAPVSTKKSGRK